MIRCDKLGDFSDLLDDAWEDVKYSNNTEEILKLFTGVIRLQAGIQGTDFHFRDFIAGENTGCSKNTEGINQNPLKAITPNSFSHSIMTLPFENVEYNTKFNVDVMKKWALGKILTGFELMSARGRLKIF